MLPVFQCINQEHDDHYYQYIFCNKVFKQIFPVIINRTIMNVCIHQDDCRQKNNATGIKFVKEWKIFFCFQESYHKSHKKTNTKDLKYKIHVCFIEKIAFRRSVIIILFCKKHEPKKKSIGGIIEKLPVSSL